MAKIKREFVFLTCLSSGLAVILSFAALATQQWIVADGYFQGTGINDKASHIKYGLFSGTLEQTIIGSGIVYEITMTCSFGDNACAMLCGNGESERKQELSDLLINECIQFNPNCPHVTRAFKTDLYAIDCDANFERSYITAGCYLSTLIFLVLSTCFGLLSTILSVWNTGGNPVQAVFNIFGLYIFNAIAAIFVLLAVCIWGVEYSVKLFYNPAILYTILGQMKSGGLVFLGFSYWILLGSLFFYVFSIFLLKLRQYLIEKEQEAKIDTDGANENMIM